MEWIMVAALWIVAAGVWLRQRRTYRRRMAVLRRLAEIRNSALTRPPEEPTIEWRQLL